MPVKIKDLVAEMDMQMDEYKTILNKETGMIITVSTDDLSIAEDSEEDDDFSEYPDWQRQNILEALNVLWEWDKYVELPDKFEINEHRIMERFCSSVDNERIQDALFDAINGRGAFRRFKDTVQRFNLHNRWDSFREEALKQIAIDWCEENGIEYIV